MSTSKHRRRDGAVAVKKNGKFVGTVPAPVSPPTSSQVTEESKKQVEVKKTEPVIKLPRTKPLTAKVSEDGFVRTEISVGRRFPEEDEQAIFDKLLSVAGEKCVTPLSRETEAPQLLERGFFVPEDATVKMIVGRANGCHGNSAALWKDGKGDIVTGYALSVDGLWRQHTWVQTKRKQIFETTVPRLRYYGYMLTNEEAEEFAWENY